MTLKLNTFPYFPSHLVSNSPWPICISFALLSLTIGAVLEMHGYPYANETFNLGVVTTVAGMSLWFRDIISEATFEGKHTIKVSMGINIGFILFIISEVFAFFSVFWAFFHSSLSPVVELGGMWPPLGITPLDPYAIPLLNTIILVSSGAFVTFSHHSIVGASRKGGINGLLITLILALAFTTLQGFEYFQSSFSITDGVYGTSFFASTGLHGFHVIVGTLFLGISFFRLCSYHYTKEHHLGLECGILYWHFVDVVWLFLFIVVYFWGGNGI